MYVMKLSRFLMTFLFIIFGYLVSNVDVRAVTCNTVDVNVKYVDPTTSTENSTQIGDTNSATVRGGAGTYYNLDITTSPGGCNWTLQLANVTWAGFNGVIGTTDSRVVSSTNTTQTVQLTLGQFSDPNLSITDRSTTISINTATPKTFTIIQSVCPRGFDSVSGATLNFDISGNPSPSVSNPHAVMASAPGCGYTAIVTFKNSASNWLTISDTTTDNDLTSISVPNPTVNSPSTFGFDESNLYLFAQSNSEGKSRFATITLFTGDHLEAPVGTWVVTQATCSVSISVVTSPAGSGTFNGSNLSFGEPTPGGTERIDVSADSGCNWAVVPHSPWFSVTDIDQSGTSLGTTLGHGNARIILNISSGSCAARSTVFQKPGGGHGINAMVTRDTGLDISDTEYDFKQTGPGDVNGDFVTSVGDLLFIANFLAGNTSLTSDQRIAADTFDTGARGPRLINIQDLFQLAQFLAGNTSCLPVCQTGANCSAP